MDELGIMCGQHVRCNLKHLHITKLSDVIHQQALVVARNLSTKLPSVLHGHYMSKVPSVPEKSYPIKVVAGCQCRCQVDEEVIICAAVATLIHLQLVQMAQF